MSLGGRSMFFQAIGEERTHPETKHMPARHLSSQRQSGIIQASPDTKTSPRTNGQDIKLPWMQERDVSRFTALSQGLIAFFYGLVTIKVT